MWKSLYHNNSVFNMAQYLMADDPDRELYVSCQILDIYGLDYSRYLPIIISFEEVEIADSYHKFLGLTRSGDTMALYDINPIFSIDMDSLSAI